MNRIFVKFVKEYIIAHKMFKLPSIVKLPQYRRFEYTPRYYDPVKEEIEQELKKRRMFRKEKGEEETDEKFDTAVRIKGSFKNYRQRNTSFTGVLRLIIVVLLLSSFVLYLFFGNIAFYVLAASVVGVYFLSKSKLFNPFSNE